MKNETRKFDFANKVVLTLSEVALRLSVVHSRMYTKTQVYQFLNENPFSIWAGAELFGIPVPYSAIMSYCTSCPNYIGIGGPTGGTLPLC